jgi:hypothetical protein
VRVVGKEVAAASASVSSLIWEVASNGVWVCTTLGYAGYTFSIGGLAVWAPSYLQVLVHEAFKVLVREALSY